LRRVTIAAFVLVVISSPVAAYGDTEEGHRWDGNRTTPVHRLPLIDEEGQEIVPEYRYAMPFSARATCGPCHDYSAISGGFHFSPAEANGSAGRAGEPWVWVDQATGTQLPISYRGWPGTWTPAELGLAPWRFTQIFGRHLPGGGVSEPEDEFAGPGSRWDVSGKVEINCLGCHNASPGQDQSEWAIQMARENYRWAATAAGGLGEVTGMASRLSSAWTVHDGPDPGDNPWIVPPSVRYDITQFDSKSRAFFDVVRGPQDQRCLYCHSVSEVGCERWQTDRDVHSTAGLQCVDCHRNGLDHDIVRGYEGEALDRGDPVLADFSCRGCHLGSKVTTGGRLGAPRPEHKGLPPVHLDQLTCTACHSGPLPEPTPARVRTSRANRLGIYGKAQWYTDAPYIAEPVFMRGEDGKIGPYRMMWPAFWGRVEADKVVPLLPDDIEQVAEGILDAEQQIGGILAAMSMGLARLAAELGEPEVGGEAVFMMPGKIYHYNADGGLDVSVYTGPMPVTGPLWARDRDGEVMPLVPESDPAAAELDVEVEDSILAILGALAFDNKAEPVVTFGNKVYRRTFDGLLEASERSDDATDTITWGWRQEDGTISALVPEFVVRAVTATVGIEESFTEEQAAMMLEALADDEIEHTGESAEFVYVSGGKMFRRTDTGMLAASDHPAAEPYSWPMAHDVRPAVQSLGAKSCTECHAKDTPFFFGVVTAVGPLKTEIVAVTPVRELHGEEGPMYVRTNQFFKWFIIVTMTLLSLHIIADLTRRALHKRAG